MTAGDGRIVFAHNENYFINYSWVVGWMYTRGEVDTPVRIRIA